MAQETPPTGIPFPRSTPSVDSSQSRPFSASSTMGREVAAIGLVLVTLFLVIALATSVSGTHATGMLGMRAAQGLQFFLGHILAYSVPVGLLAVAVLLWKGVALRRVPERILGASLLVLAVCGLIAIPQSGQDLSGNPAFYYGGAAGHALVHSRTLNLLGALGLAGCILILVSVAILGGLLLSWRSPRGAIRDLGRLLELIGQMTGMIRPVGQVLAADQPRIKLDKPSEERERAPRAVPTGASIWSSVTREASPAATPRLSRLVTPTAVPQAAIHPPAPGEGAVRVPEIRATSPVASRPASAPIQPPPAPEGEEAPGLFPRFTSDSQLRPRPESRPAPVSGPVALWEDEDSGIYHQAESPAEENVSPALQDWPGFPRRRRPSDAQPTEGSSYMWLSGAPPAVVPPSQAPVPWADEVVERIGSSPVPPAIQVSPETVTKPPIDSDFAPNNTINPSKPVRVCPQSNPWSTTNSYEEAQMEEQEGGVAVESVLPVAPQLESWIQPDSAVAATSEANGHGGLLENSDGVSNFGALEQDPWMGWGTPQVRPSEGMESYDQGNNGLEQEESAAEPHGVSRRIPLSAMDAWMGRATQDSPEVDDPQGSPMNSAGLDAGTEEYPGMAYRESLEPIPGIWPGNRSQADFLMDPEYTLPRLDLFDTPPACLTRLPQEVLLELADRLQACLVSHNIDAQVENAVQGPAVIRFDLRPAHAQRVAPIARLDREIAIAMRSDRVRILGPAGGGTIGVEIPSPSRETVYLADLLRTHVFSTHPAPLAIPLGKGMSGEPVLCDLATTPHLLIAGSTGQGKSVCLNTILISLLMRRTPDELRLLLIDPKQVELNFFRAIPHLLAPIITEPRKAAAALVWVCELMEHRYELCRQLNARNIDSYNAIARGGANHPKSGGRELEVMPHIIVVIDELADLMLQVRREIEDPFSRLAAKARACGIHLIVATQRPSVDVITGTIKNNFPSRIAFLTKTEADSRTVLGQSGAENLLGKGDMIYDLAGAPALQRVQGCFVSEADVERVAEYLRQQAPVRYVKHDFPVAGDEGSRNGRARSVQPEDGMPGSGSADDEMERTYERALRLVLEARKASVSMVQRKLQIGFPKAGRLMDMMEERGIVGPADSSKVREILVDPEDFLRRLDEAQDGIYYDE